MSRLVVINDHRNNTFMLKIDKFVVEATRNFTPNCCCFDQNRRSQSSVNSLKFNDFISRKKTLHLSRRSIWKLSSQNKLTWAWPKLSKYSEFSEKFKYENYVKKQHKKFKVNFEFKRNDKQIALSFSASSTLKMTHFLKAAHKKSNLVCLRNKCFT